MPKRVYRPLTVSVEPALEGRLKRLAFQHEVSVSAIVSLALEKLLGGKDDDQAGRILERGKAAKRRPAPG